MIMVASRKFFTRPHFNAIVAQWQSRAFIRPRSQVRSLPVAHEKRWAGK